MSAVDQLPLPEIYYQPSSKDYWREDACGRWIRIDKESAKQLLIACGVSNEPLRGMQSAAVEAILRIQAEKNLDYAGPLAGYDAGFYQMNRSNVLVTESPHMLLPVEGEWPTIRSLLEGLLKDPVHDQRPYLFGWLKIALQSFYAHKWSPGQVLALAGPAGSGKSLLQRLITEMFGGRAANPYQYMTGETSFNADLFRCEHLAIEDDNESTDYKSRRHFAGNIKKIAVNRDQPCHGKYKEALTLYPCWRMTISVNDDPLRLLVLPPIDSDVADKITLFKVAKHQMPMPTETPEQIEAFWAKLIEELPAFIHFILNWEIPNNLRSARCGITHYHHPEILRVLDDFSPEARLLSLIDIACFTEARPLDVTATELERKLTHEHSSVRREASQLLSYSSACGLHLTRLTTTRPERVSKRTIHGKTRYRIQPPFPDDQGSCDSNGWRGLEGLSSSSELNLISGTGLSCGIPAIPCNPSHPTQSPDACAEIPPVPVLSDEKS